MAVYLGLEQDANEIGPRRVAAGGDEAVDVRVQLVRGPDAIFMGVDVKEASGPVNPLEPILAR